jgi:hypothetical protein
MTDAAAITAQLVDVRNVAAHKSVRLELHVPAEQAGLVMAAFGWPTMADPVPVALARLNPIAKPTVSQPETVQRERKPFTGLPYAQQAAMRCQEPQFWSYLAQRQDLGLPTVENAADAADAVRSICIVDSRSRIAVGTIAGGLWESIEADYFAWSRGMR